MSDSNRFYRSREKTGSGPSLIHKLDTGFRSAHNVVVIDTTTLPTQPLKALGFSEIESLVYAYLVGREPTTGYRVSHAIGKPTANTYKAIASLQQAGAVLVDEGDNRDRKSVV